MTTIIGLDTSVAVPLLVQTHKAHRVVVKWWNGQPSALSGHALIETYSVLTRLPGDIRLSGNDAARLISARFAEPLMLDRTESMQLPSILAELGVAGGATYDAIVGLAAARNGCALATRDARARPTYDAVGADVIVVA